MELEPEVGTNTKTMETTKTALTIALLVVLTLFPFSFVDLWTGKMAANPGDTYWFSWLLSHHWRQWFGTGFASYFDAGIFAPLPRTLLFSENFIGPALLGLPVHLLGGNPLAAFHFVNVVGTLATVLAMYAFAWRLTGRRVLAMMCSLFFGLSAFQISHITCHLQMSFSFFFPLAFLATMEWVRDPRWKWWLLLVVTWASLFYFNVYYFAFLSYSVSFWFLYLWMRRPEPESKKGLREWARMRGGPLGFATAAATVIALVAPIAFLYWKLKTEFPNLAFDESARDELQLDFASIVRSMPGMWLARARGTVESVGYPGVGILGLIVAYGACRLGDWMAGKAGKGKLLAELGRSLGVAIIVSQVVWLLVFGFIQHALRSEILNDVLSFFYLALLIQALVYVLARIGARTGARASAGIVGSEQDVVDPWHSGFFLLFALGWFFVGMGANFFGGHQPFHFFLESVPILNGVRAIGRAYVLTSFGLALFAAHIVDDLWQRRSTTMKVLAVTFVLAGVAEFIWFARLYVGQERHDPAPILALAHGAGVDDFYARLAARYPEAPVFEVPAQNWTEQMRVLQFGSALRDTLVRFQGLSGFTPEFSLRASLWLNDEDVSQSTDWKITEELVLNLPVRFFIVRFDMPTQPSPRLLKLFREHPAFQQVDEWRRPDGTERALVFEKHADRLARFGFVPHHPLLALGIRDYVSKKARVDEKGRVAISCEGEKDSCEVSLFWPFFSLAPGAEKLIIEFAGSETTTDAVGTTAAVDDVTVRIAGRPLEEVGMVVKSVPSTPAAASTSTATAAAVAVKIFRLPPAADLKGVDRLHLSIKRHAGEVVMFQGIYQGSHAPHGSFVPGRPSGG